MFEGLQEESQVLLWLSTRRLYEVAPGVALQAAVRVSPGRGQVAVIEVGELGIARVIVSLCGVQVERAPLKSTVRAWKVWMPAVVQL